MRRTEVRISLRPVRPAFTFIAPEGFSHPKTRTHVRLLGPCFKTGRIKPYDRQRPRLVSAETPQESTEVLVHCTQSTLLTVPASEEGLPEGTSRDSSVRPEPVTESYNTTPRRCHLLPRRVTRCEHSLTRTPEKCDGSSAERAAAVLRICTTTRRR